MKHPRNLFALLLMAGFACVMNSCSLNETPEPAAAASPQLIQDNGGAIYCRACDNGCVLGYSFTPANIDGNHPQGGFKLAVIKGQCECDESNGKFFARTTGSVQTMVGQIGGPGSGSLPSPMGHAWLLFNFNCIGGGGGGIIGGNIDIGESWAHFIHQVNQNFSNPVKLGLLGWPDAWNVTVRLPLTDGNVLVDLPHADQAQQLEEINLHSNDGEEPIATVTANGASQYELDLSDLPIGDYHVELKFAPGFSLLTPIYRYVAPE